MIGALAAGELDLLSLWGEPGTVHAAVLDGGRVAVLSLDCPDGKFPSVGARHAPAIRFERALADLYGLVAKDAKDTRPWRDHGRWEMRHPLANAPATGEASAPYPFLAVDGEHLHQIPVGPVHAGIIEPGHFRFTANGETVARLEVRLGYAHKGIAGLMRGQDLAGAAHLAGHVSGDSTVAYAIAFARAAEAALGIEAPARAHWLRALMAEIERLANHFGDIGAICNDASFSIMHAHCAVLRESLLRFADTHFGHRLMMGAVVPGGVGVDLAADGGRQLLGLAAQIKGRFAQLTELYDNAASLLDRTVGTGLLKPELARRFAAGGFVGRASGRDFDARRDLPYPPYDRLGFAVP
ncbi:MAG: hydrogenase expression protein HypE, partial [Cucumibacter sp.]